MKHQKRLFNAYMLRYQKYYNKLVRLNEAGKNEHRQAVLKRHLTRLFEKLNSLCFSVSKKTALAASFAGVMALSTQSASAQIEFAGGGTAFDDLITGDYQPSPAMADLDNDGDLDVLLGSYYGELYYFENTGTATDPSFGPSQINAFGLSATSYWSMPTFVDIDGDGDFDVVSGHEGPSLRYYENVGTPSAPSFAASTPNPFGLTGLVGHRRPTFADMDNDGDVDLMLYENINGVSGEFKFFENIGNATAPNFASFSSNPFGLSSVSPTISYNQFDLGDVDNDGDYDLIGGGWNGDFFFFENTGTPSAPAFGAQQTNPLGTQNVGANSNIPVFTDIDNDGDLDILAADYYSNNGLHFFENTGGIGSPMFELVENLPVLDPFGLSSFVSPAKPTLADLDNDGDLDLLIGAGQPTLYYNENIGTAAAASFGITQNDPFGIVNTAGYGTLSPSLVDLDNDGDLDLFHGSDYGNFFFYENTGTASSPAFGPQQMDPFGTTSLQFCTSTEFADLDNDGDVDLIAGHGYGTHHYYENVGTNTSPSFAVPVTNPFGLVTNGGWTSPKFVDLDGDNDLDIISGNFNGNFYYFENTGNASAPTFGPPQTNPFSLTDIGNGSYPAFGDLDNDGDLDILAGAQNGDLLFIENLTPGCGVDPTISVNANVLTAVQTGATYQWVDCNNANAPIAGETNQTFTPVTNGNYACIIDDGSCSELSECETISTIGMNELEVHNIGVYPNPATDVLTIKSDSEIKSIKLFDVYGNFVRNEEENSFSVLELKAGVYLLQIETSRGIVTKRFVKN